VLFCQLFSLENTILYWYTIGEMATARKTPKTKASTPKKTVITGKKPQKAASKPLSVKNTVKRVPKPKNAKLPPVEDRICSFCHKTTKTAKYLIAGPPPLNPFICDECIDVCYRILADADPQECHYHLTRILEMIEQKNPNLAKKGRKADNAK